jgi:TRAP-type uncharacterized transport system substrate-binding protein
MKNLIILTVLGATFLSGYHLGRKPDSPDVIGWLSEKSGQAYVIGKDVAATVSEKSKSIIASVESSQ